MECITFGALLSAIGVVIYQILAKNVTPSAIFSQNVLVDDRFGSFFAIAMLIVGIMTTVGSFNYMRGRANPDCILFTNSSFINWNDTDCILY